MIYLTKSYGKLVSGVPYEIKEEGRDYFVVNNHYIPKNLCKTWVPEIDEEREYEEFV